MFDHLDDPNPPAADAAVRTAVTRRAARQRRRNRLVVALGVVVAAAAIGSFAADAAFRSGNRRVTVVTEPTPTSVATPPTTAAPPTTAVPTPAQTLDCGALNATGPGRAVASLDGVTAVLSGQLTTVASMPSLAHATLAVSLNGATLFTVPVAPPTGAPALMLTDIGPTSRPNKSVVPMCLARFAGSELPTVLLGLWTGGAHCCVVVRQYSPPDGRSSDADLGNSGAHLDVDGTAVIITSDNAFYYQFAYYADSVAPAKVLEVKDAAFTDTTAQHLEVVRADATRWNQGFDGNPGHGLGYIAAWTADQCRLDQQAQAFARLDELNRQGRLTGPSGWPTGSDFIAKLRQFLADHHYC